MRSGHLQTGFRTQKGLCACERDIWIVKNGKGKAEGYMDRDNCMIDEVLRHLDSELALGAVRMSVVFDDKAEDEKSVSHKCCHSYGRPATETVGLLDMYTDISAGVSDRG